MERNSNIKTADLRTDRRAADNSTYKKLAVQWLNEALCFVSSSVLADSFVLRNRQLLVAAKRYAQLLDEPPISKLRARNYMSLVVSKIIDNKIYIESDSRVTDINEAIKESIYGVLKSLIVYPQLNISFAGSIYLAEKAIKDIYARTNLTLPYLIETLLRFNSDDNSVEFIVSTLKYNNAGIIKISNGKVENGLTSAWIGDIDGFNDFQKNFHELNTNGISIKDAFTNAFSKVVENPNIPTVGDFQVSTITEIGPKGDFFFRYFEKFMLHRNEPQTLIISGNQESRLTMSWGSAAGGSYGICFFVSVTPLINAIAYYFVHGNFGVLFCPKLSFEGIVIRNKSNLEFLEHINEYYQIPMRGFVLRNNNTAMQLIDMRTAKNA